MKYKLDKKDLENLKKVKQITMTDYEVDDNGYMTGSELACMIDELIGCYEHTEEEWKKKYENLEQNLRENYTYTGNGCNYD